MRQTEMKESSRAGELPPHGLAAAGGPLVQGCSMIRRGLPATPGELGGDGFRLLPLPLSSGRRLRR